MNTKYIELSQALEVLDSCSCWWAHERMAHIPAADVRPVVRGKWKVYNNTYMCSSCGQPVSFWQSNFCPNCGADMREES